MTLYSFLLLIHVFSAILGLGPGFVMIYIVTKAKNMTELKHAYFIRNRVHVFVMVGGTLLLLTGLLMGAINTALFYAGWYVSSLILFLIALAFGPLVLSPRAKPVKALLESHRGEEIPEEYYRLSKKLFFMSGLKMCFF